MDEQDSVKLPAEEEQIEVALPRIVLLGVVAAIAYFSFSYIVFCAWVHYRYGGNFSGPLFISQRFGISEASRDAGAFPVFDHTIPGWDGQFYYTQSNDPLILEDYSDTTLFDGASYRYQRNGLSMLAWISSRLSGRSLTSPIWFLLTQLTVVSIGFGVLVAFLKNHGRAWWWALIWAFSAGVLRPMMHGLPDPTADTLLLLAALGAIYSNVFVYVVAAAALCLCRESYAAPAAVVWLLTLLGKLDWGGRQDYHARVVMTALPGVAVVAWAGYVAFQTNTAFLEGSRSAPWGALVDWPFRAFVQESYIDYKSGNTRDLIYASCCAACIAYGLFATFRNSLSQLLAVAIAPHIVLMSMTGFIIWADGVGFFKNAASILLLGVVLLAYSNSLLLRGLLLLTFAVGLHYIHLVEFESTEYLPPLLADREAHSEGVNELHPVTDIDYKSRIELLDSRLALGHYDGPFKSFSRQPHYFAVQVTNLSDATWPASQPGKDVVSFGRKFMDCQEIVREERVPIYKDVAPGESIVFDFSVPLRELVDKPRHVQMGLVHDGHAWFNWQDPDQLLDVSY